MVYGKYHLSNEGHYDTHYQKRDTTRFRISSKYL